MIGWGVVGVYDGGDVVGSCDGVFIGDTEGCFVVGVSVGWFDDSGAAMAGDPVGIIELFNDASEGEGFGELVTPFASFSDGDSVGEELVSVEEGSAIVIENAGVGTDVATSDIGDGVSTYAGAGVGM